MARRSARQPGPRRAPERFEPPRSPAAALTTLAAAATLCLACGEPDPFTRLISNEEDATQTFCDAAEACYPQPDPQLCRAPLGAQDMLTYRVPLTPELEACLRGVYTRHPEDFARESQCFAQALREAATCLEGCPDNARDCAARFDAHYDGCAGDANAPYDKALAGCQNPD